MKKEIWEYGIIFKENTTAYDLYSGEVFTEDETEMLDMRENYENEIENIYLKQWILVDRDYVENEVEIIK